MSVPVAYSGNESYIFISYSHRDSDLVLPVIERLNQQGYRVWYDSGIDPGSEWDENIAAHINSCGYFIAMMSKNYLNSSNCKDELNYARDLEKDRLVVYLEDVQLPAGMAMRINRLQSIFKYAYDQPEAFYTKLFEAQNIEKCQNTSSTVAAPVASAAPAVAAPAPVKPAAAAKKPSQKKPLGLILGIAGGAVALIILLIIILGSSSSGGKQGQNNNNNSSKYTAAAMSDNLLDFTLKLDGNVVKLPCPLSALTDKGWTLSESGVTDDAVLAGKEEIDYEMAKNGQTITVTFFNPSGNAAAIKDCLVAGFYIYGDEVKVEFPKGITVNSTKDEIIAAYGAPNDESDSSSYVRLSYYGEDNYNSYVAFRVSNDKNEKNVITVCNKVSNGVTTETSTEVPDYLSEYKAPTSSAKNLSEPVITIEGELYRMPAPLSQFVDNGWSITQKPGSVTAGGNAGVTLKKGSKTLSVQVVNLADYQTTAENCAVWMVSVYDYDNLSVDFAGIGIGSDKSAVEKAITEDFDYGEYTNLNYSYSKNKVYVSIDVDPKTNKVVKMYVKSENWDY